MEDSKHYTMAPGLDRCNRSILRGRDGGHSGYCGRPAVRWFIMGQWVFGRCGQHQSDFPPGVSHRVEMSREDLDILLVMEA